MVVPTLYRKLRKQLGSVNVQTHCRPISPTDKVNAWQNLKQSAHAITVGSAKTIQINRGGMMAVELQPRSSLVYSARAAIEAKPSDMAREEIEQ
jgi:hypothetical protein